MNDYPLTLFYDGACPVCSLEMDHLRERSRDGRLVFVDIAAPGFDAARYGATLDAMHAEIHGLLPDGALPRGVEGLRARGHRVVEGARRASGGRPTLHVDFMQPRTPAAWAETLRSAGVDTVVNCVGILMPSAGQTFERVHAEGPMELFRGAAQAGVRRIVQVSALGVGGDAQSLASPYLHSKLRADDALAALPLDWAVLRPSLVFGP